MNMADTINNFIENRLTTIYTSMPGIIKKISNGVADVQPAVSQDGVELPVLPNVPVIFPASKTAGFVFDINVGDTVMLMFSTNSIDEWLAGSGRESQTDDPRRFDITDAVAVPGLFSLSSVPNISSSDGCVMNYEDTTVKIKKNGDVEIGGATATALVRDSFIDAFNTHTHPSPAGATSPPTVPVIKATHVTAKTKAV
jgi:hypothetical protein